MSPQCLPRSLGSIRLTFPENIRFEDFQDGHHGSHLGYRNGTVFAILNLYVVSMPPIKFGLNPTYGLGGGSLKIFKMADMAAILDIRME